MATYGMTDDDWPSADWPVATPEQVGMDAALLEQARDYARRGAGAGIVVRHGKRVFAWGDPKTRYDLKSTTKSFGATALALAVADGKMALEDTAAAYCPDIVQTSADDPTWAERVTIFHLATQTAGFDKPGGYSRLLFQPGTRWAYSDCGPNWLAECVTRTYGRDVEELMFERVFTPLGITRDDLQWRENQFRPVEIEGVKRREFGSGIHANVDALARLGLLYLRRGRWRDKQIIPAALVDQVRTAPEALRGLEVVGDPQFAKASGHYGLLWWSNADGALNDVPKDAYWSWGLHESFVIVVPSLDLVVARAGKGWPERPGGPYAKLSGFLQPIVAACSPSIVPPYPPSPVIRRVAWAAPDTIIRKANDSDNWPITWADDNHQYTAYGDGRGFEPHVERKLSLGLCRVEGGPTDFHGVNLRSATAEQLGDGRSGKKASGLLCVDGVLYMFVRNAGNSQIAWSRDHGKTWTWSDWRFTTTFGSPTFLNFGKDYAGARDDYVYVYSSDSETAYHAADRMVLARVPKTRIVESEAYEFFVGLDDDQNPLWSKEIDDRGGVFHHPGRCYRSGITYNAGLKRYLWVQIIPNADVAFAKDTADVRFHGGFGIYDAPEPWGPWTTAFFTLLWDVGPGETASFPTKWMSEDGRTLHMVSSGHDHFSVRRAMLITDDAPLEP